MAEEEKYRWLVDNIVAWEKAPRPEREKIEFYINGFLGGAGSVEWKEDHWLIALPGTPSYLIVTKGWQTLESYTTRWFQVGLGGTDSILVQCLLQDKFTLRIADALTQIFYHVQRFEDQEFEKKESEAAT